MAPEGNCLQYHTSSSGTFASFAWDLSTYGPGVAVGSGIAEYTQFHLANQRYDVCFRREQGKSTICYTPKIMGKTTSTIAAASFGLGGSAISASTTQQNDGYAMKESVAAPVGRSACQGHTVFTTVSATAIGRARAAGDYLEIPQAFDTDLAAATQLIPGQASKIMRVCGTVFAVDAIATTTTPGTVCSKTTPFRVGVHTDGMEAMGVAANVIADTASSWDNWDVFTTNEGLGYSGFYLEYFQL